MSPLNSSINSFFSPLPILFALLGMSVGCTHAPSSPQDPFAGSFTIGPASGNKCDGYPALDLGPVQATPGFCLGVVSEGKVGINQFKGLVALKDLILVSDQGDPKTAKDQVRIWSFRPQPTQLDGSRSHEKTLLLDTALDLKPELRTALKGLVYLKALSLPNEPTWVYGSGTRSIFRFRLPKSYNPKALREEILKTLEIVIDRVPPHVEHPSALGFEFSPDGRSLLVAVPTAKNSCDDPLLVKDQNLPCSEAEGKNPEHDNAIGILIRYAYLQKKKGYSTEPRTVAVGLRTPELLGFNADRTELFQIDQNPISSPGQAFFGDEINVLAREGHYGWPYCVEYNRLSAAYSESKWDCSEFDSPWLLLPPQSQPSSLIFYKGALFPKWLKGRLIVALSGVWPSGGRLVTFEKDRKGSPMGRPLSIISPLQSVSFSPSALALSPDGAVYVLDRSSQKLLRLFYDPDRDPSEGEGKSTGFVYDDPWIYKNAPR